MSLKQASLVLGVETGAHWWPNFAVLSHLKKCRAFYQFMSPSIRIVTKSAKLTQKNYFTLDFN